MQTIFVTTTDYNYKQNDTFWSLEDVLAKGVVEGEEEHAVELGDSMWHWDLPNRGAPPDTWVVLVGWVCYSLPRPAA